MQNGYGYVNDCPYFYKGIFTGYLCQILLVLVVASYLRLFGRFCCLVGSCGFTGFLTLIGGV